MTKSMILKSKVILCSYMYIIIQQKNQPTWANDNIVYTNHFNIDNASTDEPNAFENIQSYFESECKTKKSPI